MVTICRCRTDDVPDVLAFIDEHWKRGHIFVHDRALFDWQYRRRDRPGEYAIAIARRDTDRALLGMLGFIPTSHFDAALASDNAIWLALWAVRRDSAGPLGLRLLTDVTGGDPHVSVGVVGFQEGITSIYKALKFEVGELKHYVLPNPNVTQFEIASFERPPVRVVKDLGLTATHIDERNFERTVDGFDFNAGHYIPRKSAEYVGARYLRHPIYTYRVLALRRGDATLGVLVLRVATHGHRRALRVIDYIGPPDTVPGIGAVVLAQLRHFDAEYADLHNHGLDPALFEAAGFTAVDPSGRDIVPDHFEPFERRNVPIRFALNTDRPAVLFKGDGDQDRPNQRPTP
jgi:hypothetical protein